MMGAFLFLFVCSFVFDGFCKMKRGEKRVGVKLKRLIAGSTYVNASNVLSVDLISVFRT